MPGPVALVADPEVSRHQVDVDRALLAAVGRRRPRVVILPTAAGRDEPAFLRATAVAHARFHPLGAEVETVAVRTRDDAHDPRHVQAVGEADLVYLAPGSASQLVEILAASPVLAAIRDVHARGSTVASCTSSSAGLGDRMLRIGPRLGLPVQWRVALALIPAVVVIPAYDERPEPLRALPALFAPRGTSLLGLDHGASVVGIDGAWQVEGRGRVTVWRGRRRERHRPGEAFRL